MSGHVVVTLQRVRPVRRSFRHRPIEPGLEIPPHARRGVLVQRQRSRRVLDQQMKQPNRHLPQLGQCVDDFVRDEMEPARHRRQPDRPLEPHRQEDAMEAVMYPYAS
jgi:hypothetical protein